MKKLNITKKQYDESKYFNKKYGSIKFVSESGKSYKTDKGVVLALEGTEEVAPADGEVATEEKDDDVVKSEEITRGELTDMLTDVVDAVKKVCDDQDVSYEEVIGVETKGESESGDKDEVVATSEEVAEVLQNVINKVEDVAKKNDIELPEEEEEDDVADESIKDMWDATKKTAGELGDKMKGGIKKAKKAIGDAIKGPFRKGDQIEIQNKEGDSASATVIDGELGGKKYTVMLQRAMDEGNECDGEKCDGSTCECGEKCECDKTTLRESRIRRAKAVRESIARRARIRKIRESIERKARVKKILESIRRKRTMKRIMESRKMRGRTRMVRKAK